MYMHSAYTLQIGVHQDGYLLQTRFVIRRIGAVVHIMMIVGDMYMPLDIVIVGILIYITVHLAGQISDHQSHSRGRIAHLLALRYGVPVALPPQPSASLQRIPQGDQIREPKQELQTQPVGRLAVMANQNAVQHTVELTPPNGHEIALYVQFQHPAITGIVTAHGADMVLQTPDAKERALAFTAGGGIVYQQPLYYRINRIVIQMMYDAIVELAGKHLPADGIGDDKADTGSGDITAVTQCLI